MHPVNVLPEEFDKLVFDCLLILFGYIDTFKRPCRLLGPLHHFFIRLGPLFDESAMSFRQRWRF